ncbi:MAG: type II toxin-antitoxin system VapC family toxin [Pseudomonadota bacterium]
MIVLDTNVVSETMRATPQPSVVDWLNSKDEMELFICAPVLAELRYGEQLLPAGRRRNALSAAIDQVEHKAFRGRILPFDQAAASVYARLAAMRKSKGLPLNQMDGLIAAITASQNAVLCTRDEDGFAELGLAVINPFKVETR